jgi:uncharacterized protein (DUF486 family)
MDQPILPRLGAACGALFAIVLVVAAGNGDQAYSTPRAVAGLAALTLFLPFAAYLHSLLREGGWLATAALVGGVTGIGLKIASGIPDVAFHRAHALHGLGVSLADTATVVALYPLAVLCAATAVIALRTGALPRWLGVAAGVTAASLLVNGAFLETSNVPALLLFIAWTLVASLYLLRVPARRSSAAARS